MLKVNILDREFLIDRNNGTIQLNGEPVDWDLVRLSDHEYHIIYKGKSITVLVEEKSGNGKELKLRVNGEVFLTRAAGKLDQLLEEMGIDTEASNKVQTIQAPMPGRISQVMITPEQEVAKGDPLLILEAMKMENVIKAPGDGVVDRIEVKEGQSVEKNQTMISFKA